LAALNYLYQKEEYVNVHKPGIIVLDIHLPVLDGIGVLTEINKHKHLRNIPIVILTSDTNKEGEIKKYTSLNYMILTKPPTLNEYGEFITSIAEFCINNNHQPVS
jgi:DNA-binding response OmpR family regulator